MSRWAGEGGEFGEVGVVIVVVVGEAVFVVVDVGLLLVLLLAGAGRRVGLALRGVLVGKIALLVLPQALFAQVAVTCPQPQSSLPDLSYPLLASRPVRQ